MRKKPRVLIVTDATRKLTGRSEWRSDMDIQLLESWLTALNIHRIKPCWLHDKQTLATWNGPIIALGRIAYDRLKLMPNRVAWLPFPGSGNKRLKDEVFMARMFSFVNKELWAPREMKRLVIVK